MSSQIINSGLTPAFNDPTYKEFYRINDNNIGKYISMIGSKDFYNPGIGLSLSTPITGPTTTTLKLTNLSSDNSGFSLITSASGGDTAMFYIFNTMNPQGDLIPGFVNAPTQIINGSNLGPLTNIQSVVSQGNHRILNVLQDGSYTFTFTAAGTVSQTSDRNFFFQFAFYLNINGNETILHNNFVQTQSTFVGGQTEYAAVLNFNFPIFSQTFQLKVGDWVQIYGKSIANVSSLSCNVSLNSSVITISQTIANAPTQTVFTNPLNIPNLNLTGITYYGAARDTLILQGNKLTS